MYAFPMQSTIGRVILWNAPYDHGYFRKVWVLLPAKGVCSGGGHFRTWDDVLCDTWLPEAFQSGSLTPQNRKLQNT